MTGKRFNPQLIERLRAAAGVRYLDDDASEPRTPKNHPGWRVLDNLRAALILGLALVIVTACGEPTSAQSVVDPPATLARTTGNLSAPDGAVLAEVRRATQRFRDVEVALAEGYLRDPSDMCFDAPMEGMPRQLGGMGIHFFRPDLLGITAIEPRVDGTGIHTDFTRPALLIYEPQADGSLELVAVENMVFVEAWHAAGNTEPPSFLGNEYYRMHDNPETEVDEAHGFAPHYELHVWLYRHNPNGMFMQFNPNVSCQHHTGHTGTH